MSDARQQDLFSQDLPPWELDASHECPAASVVFAEAPYGPFHYRIPERLAGIVAAGMRVRVPLGKGNRPMVGYCLGVEIVNTAPSLLKEVQESIDAAPLCTGNVLKLIHWMARYYIVPIGQVFEAVIPAGVRSEAGVKMRVVLTLGPKADDGDLVERLPAKQKEVLLQLKQVGVPVTIDQLQKLANCSTGPIQSLRQAEFILSRSERTMEDFPGERVVHQKPMPPALSADQRQAMVAIQRAIDSNQQQTICCMV